MNYIIDEQTKLKSINKIFVLNYARHNKSITKPELAEVTGLSIMTIHKIIEELREERLLKEVAYQSQSGLGRKAVVYSINKNYGYTIGLYINIFKTTAALMNFQGEILKTSEVMIDEKKLTATETIGMLFNLIEDILPDHDTDEKKIIGIGVAAPGPLNPETGMILSPPNFEALRYMPIKKMIEDRFKVPVFLHKDTNAIAMAEYWYGNYLNIEKLIYVDADIGIGSGLIENGSIYPGENYAAGEFGHLTIDINGPRCNCGNFGCLEAMGSGISIIREAKKYLADNPKHTLHDKKESLSITDIIKEAVNGDIAFVSLLNEAANIMGTAISGLINILDPGMVVLGGILTLTYPPYFGIVKHAVKSKLLRRDTKINIRKSEYGDKAGIIGAGEIVINDFFQNQMS